MSVRQDALAAELRALKNREGLIVPREVVAWAKRNRNSLLHHKLDWDDKSASQSWREHQVRMLIAVHVIEIDGHPVREFPSIPSDRIEGGGYRDIRDVVKKKNLREQMLEEAVNELKRVKEKYEHLVELKAIWDAIR